MTLSPTETREIVSEILEGEKKEERELKEELNRDISIEANAGFDPIEFSPRQHMILDHLYEKKLLIEGLEDFLRGRKILGKKENDLVGKISDLNDQEKGFNQELNTVKKVQSKILAILSK